MKQCLGHFLFFLQLRFIYCRGVARIFKGGTHCVKLRVLTSFRHLNIVGCFLKKRFTNGGLRAPQDPPPPPVATSLGNKENFEDKGAQKTRFCHLRKFCGHSTSYNCSPTFS